MVISKESAEESVLEPSVEVTTEEPKTFDGDDPTEIQQEAITDEPEAKASYVDDATKNLVLTKQSKLARTYNALQAMADNVSSLQRYLTDQLEDQKAHLARDAINITIDSRENKLFEFELKQKKHKLDKDIDLANKLKMDDEDPMALRISADTLQVEALSIRLLRSKERLKADKEKHASRVSFLNELQQKLGLPQST